MSSTHAGKVAIVTGSARSIGAAIASQLASELGKVGVNYNIGEAAAEDVVAAILRDGGKALAVQADVRTSAGAERLFVVAEAELGPVDYLVNNAGAILYKPLADVTDNGFNSADICNIRGHQGRRLADEPHFRKGNGCSQHPCQRRLTGAYRHGALQSGKRRGRSAEDGQNGCSLQAGNAC